MRVLLWVAPPAAMVAILWISLVLELPTVVALIAGGLALTGVVYLVDLLERLFPQRITLG